MKHLNLKLFLLLFIVMSSGVAAKKQTKSFEPTFASLEQHYDNTKKTEEQK